MMSEEGTKCCNNCKKDIPSVNYQMHTVHCSRKIQLCALCDEPVPSVNLEDHHKEFHSVVTCAVCFDEFENSESSQHKKEICRKRIVSCQHCDLELKAEEILEHEDYCGSRTECCPGCGKFVMFKFQQLHLDSGHSIINLDKAVHNSHSEDSVSNGQHNFKSDAFEPRRDRNDRKNQLNGLRRTNRPHRSSLDEYFQNMDLEGFRRIPTNRINEVVHDVEPLMTHNHDSQQRILIPCEFCEMPVAADQLVLHQTGCRPDLLSFRRENNHTSTNGAQNGKKNLIHEYIISDDEDSDGLAEHEKKTQDVVIPCEFCSGHFSLETITAHQVGCENDRYATRSASNRRSNTYDL